MFNKKDQFLGKTELVMDYGVVVTSSDDCAKTERAIYTSPIYIEDNDTVYAYGVSKNLETGAPFVFLLLNGEEIFLDDFNESDFVNASLYYYNSEKDYYEYVYSQEHLPFKSERLIKPVLLLSCKNLNTQQRYLKVFKSQKDVIKIEPDEKSGLGKIELSPDGMWLYNCYRNGNDQTTVYEKYDLSKAKVNTGCRRIIIKNHSNKSVNQEDDCFHFYFTMDSSKAAVVTKKYIDEHCVYSFIENEFEDDNTEVIDVSVNKADGESIGFLNQICPLTGRLAYGLDPIEAVHVVVDTIEYNAYLRKQVSSNKKEAYIDLFNSFQCKYSLTEEDAAQYIFDNYGAYRNRLDIMRFCVEHKLDFPHRGKEWKEKYNKMYEELIEAGLVPLKWKSEMDMYKLIKRKFQDAVFQYHDGKLLGMQSFDVYIPSMRIAFEYQGKQHFEAIDFFGGKEGFMQNRERDERKKRICDESGISLIEWRYDEPISTSVLRRKLGDLSNIKEVIS